MAHEFYSKWWITSEKALKQLTALDHSLQLREPTENNQVAHHLIGGLWARYNLIVQDLDACLDQICQVQKRFLIRKMLDAAVQRLTELKEELTKLEISEFHYIDGNLIELKIIPHDIQILQPSLSYPRAPDIQDMWNRIQRKETIFEHKEEILQEESHAVLKHAPVPRSLSVRIVPEPTAVEEIKDTDQSTSKQESKDDDTQEEGKKKKGRFQGAIEQTEEEKAAIKQKEDFIRATVFLQKHERARQARMYLNDIVTNMRKKDRRGPKTDEETKQLGAIRLQRFWKGFAARSFVKDKEDKRRILIGMNESSFKPTAEYDKFQKNLTKRRNLRDQYIREYIQMNIDEKERILRVKGPGIMEDISDEIREWFYQFYIRAGAFDTFPDEEDGGTVLVVRGETLSPEEWVIEQERIRKEKEYRRLNKALIEQAKAKAKKLADEKKKQEKEKAAREKERAKKETQKFKIMASTAVEKIDEGHDEHRKVWESMDESKNPLQKPYIEMVTSDKFCEAHIELRRIVDEMMRLELELLREALIRDKTRLKGKKGKKGKKNKDKKKKKKKGKKGKPKKDPTAHRTTEDLIQELVNCGVIKSEFPTAKLSDFHGDLSYANFDMRRMGLDPPTTLGDVRKTVMMNAILPMGAEIIKRPRSVLLVGHHNSGKHLLAKAIIAQTVSVVFDLTPKVTANIYKGKAEMKMFIHLLNKVSRILQPSILYFDGAEKVFWKKVPPEEKQNDPKKFQKKLFKEIVKCIKPEDKVLVLGVCNEPWTANKKLTKAFEKIIVIPPSDYGSVFLYWRELLMPYHGIDRNFEVSPLAKVTVGWPMCQIRDVVKRVMTVRRIIALKNHPLHQSELLEAILDGPDVLPQKEAAKMIKWYFSTPMGKKKKKANKLAEIRREVEAKMKEMQKKQEAKQAKAEQMAAKKLQQAAKV